MSKLSKHQQTLKKQRRAERVAAKDEHNATYNAFRICTVTALNAAKQVWGKDATNPKLEQFLIRMLKTWEDIGDRKVSFQTICDTIELESKIQYDIETGSFYNLKGPKKSL